MRKLGIGVLSEMVEKQLLRAIAIPALCLSLAIAADAPPACESALCRMVNAASEPGLRWPDFSDYAARIRKFYEPAGYGFAWTRDGEPTAQAKAMIAAFAGAEEKGLAADDYDASRWRGRLAALSPANLAAFDLEMTVSAMRYMADLHFGRANPGLYHSRADEYEELADMPGFLRQLVSAADPVKPLDALEPPYPGYRRTEQALRQYLALAARGPLPVLPVPAKPVEPGAAYGPAAQLAEILARWGDLRAEDTAAAQPGTYAEPLVSAVKKFQARHGLDADGRLGKSTVAQLNVPPQVRVQQLGLTLERWRWAPHSFPRPPVVVNIPEFRLRALNAAYLTDVEMKVVAGKAYGHKTPVFSADMKSVVFRPYWDVPYSITRAELAPKIEKDRTYLSANRYEVVDAAGNVVSENAASAARLRDGTLRVRQLPGPENALGLVKFLLPNEHNVYLHSTPAKELFEKSRRDFSHGCIRVEKPEELAGWVLRNEKPEWTPERIRDAMNGDATLQVTLSRPIPVLIVYATAVVMETGEVRFFDDIYHEDALLERALADRSPAHR